MTIENMLVLSTAHMPESQPDFGEFRVLEDEYCFVAFVSEFLFIDSKVPEWLEPVMEYAIDKNCSCIIFDMGADTVPTLKTWEW
jgi:hypothetical protein